MIYKTQQSSNHIGDHYIESSIIYPNPSKEPESHDIKYIDLGLPSGTLWADRNLGAYNPEDDGLYFSYGETTGHADFDEEKPYFSKLDYTGNAYQALTAYTDPAYSLDEKTGDYTQMATKDQWEELFTYCSVSISSDGKIATLIGPNDDSIIIPVSDYLRQGERIVNEGRYLANFFLSIKEDGSYSYWYYHAYANVKTHNTTTDYVDFYRDGMTIRSVKVCNDLINQTLSIKFTLPDDAKSIVIPAFDYNKGDSSKLNISVDGLPVYMLRWSSGGYGCYDTEIRRNLDATEVFEKDITHTLNITAVNFYSYMFCNSSITTCWSNVTAILPYPGYGAPQTNTLIKPVIISIDLPRSMIHVPVSTAADIPNLRTIQSTSNFTLSIATKTIGQNAFYMRNMDEQISPKLSDLKAIDTFGLNAFRSTTFSEFDMRDYPNLVKIEGPIFSGAKITKLTVIDTAGDQLMPYLSSIFGGISQINELVYLGPGTGSGGFLANAISTLNKVTIGKDVTLLSSGFLYSCTPHILIFEGQTPPSFPNTVNGVMAALQGNPPSDLVVTVPNGSLDAYKAAIPALASYMVESNE